MPSPRHNPFCARCGITPLLHAYPESSCPKWIAPGSKEARELEAAWAVAEATKVADATKVDTGEPIDSAVIDNRLLCLTNDWLQAKIAKATLHLQVGLSMPKGHPSRDKQFDRALKALGGLGSS